MHDTNHKYHQPVMVDEIMEAFELNADAPLKNSDNKKIVDATLGTGGHALEFLKARANVLGIEWDKDIFEIAKKRLKSACPASENGQKPFILVNSSYENIDKICVENSFTNCDGVLMDLGVNSLQLDLEGRGFSFTDGRSPLDMRFNPDERGVDASALLNLLDKSSLMKLFSEYLDYHDAKKLTQAIVEKRKTKAYKTTEEFVSTIREVLTKKGNISAETLPFMALRIAVNTEIENIQNALPKAFSVLKSGGVLAVISFHSGEDRVVKNSFKQLSEEKLGEIKTQRPIKPKKSEVEKNPRARSAKLRLIEKI